MDAAIIKLLGRRVEDCAVYEGNHAGDMVDDNPCYQISKDYEEAAKNYFIKYGDLAWCARADEHLMKQKHRMIWERRHGYVGAPLKPREEWPNE